MEEVGSGGSRPGPSTPPPVSPGGGGPSCPWAITPAPLPVVRIWAGGSRVDVPEIPDLNPNRRPDTPYSDRKESKRGVICEFSEKSRRRLSRELATLRSDAAAFTMALTLPGDFEALTPEVVVGAFKRLGGRFAAKRSFRSVGVGWKLELQARGALHYHLLLYGLGDDEGLQAEVRSWLVAQWNSLVCSHVDDEAREHHRWLHSRDENWQSVRDMAGYFAKYLGKADSLVEPDAERGYRFWGFWNRAALPVVQPLEVVIPEKVRNSLHRVMRRKRQKNANEGKHRAIVAALQEHGLPSPFASSRAFGEGVAEPITQWQLQKLRMGYDRWGKSPYLDALPGYRSSDAYLHSIKTTAARAGYRFGKFTFKGSTPHTASIVVLGSGVPGMALDVLAWAYQLHGLEVPDFMTRAESRELRRRAAFQDERRIHHQSELGLGVRVCPRSSRAERIRAGRMPAAYAGSS